RDEERDRGDAHDVEGALERRVCVDVDFHDVDSALVLLGEARELRGDHAAWPAPLGPEVDDDGSLGLQDDFFKRRVGDVLDLHHWKSTPFSRLEARFQSPSRARLWMSL